MNINDIASWLKSGAVYNYSSLHKADNHHFVLGWGDAQIKRYADTFCEHTRQNSRGSDVFRATYFYAPDFYLETKTPWIQFEKTISIHRHELLELAKTYRETLCGSPKNKNEAHEEKHTLKNAPWKPPSMEHFKNVFSLVREQIHLGALQKAVPVIFEKAEFTINDNHKLDLLISLLEHSGVRQVYGYWSGHGGILGATPEVFFSYEASKSRLKTMSLAGTRVTSHESSQPLLKDSKEIHEQFLVTKGVYNKLKKYGTVQLSAPYPWSIGMLTHLRTDIDLLIQPEKIQLASYENFVEKLIIDLHPTPALGVASDTLHYSWLKNTDEPDGRGRYGAPFGVVHPEGLSELVVAIRNIQWDEKFVSIGSGCGLVAQSLLENEWNELALKRQTMKDFF